jgi:hypothetical protein
MEETSIPARLGEAERALHTIHFRLNQLDSQRLPDRMAGVESTMRSMQADLEDLSVTAHRTNQMVNTIRMEINADLNKMEDSLTERTQKIQGSLDKLIVRITATVTTSVVLIGVFAWVMERFQVIPAVIKAFAGG